MEIVQEIVKTMNVELDRIVLCLQRLSEEQVWQRLKPDMNSVGNLCLHLAGNEHQNLVSGIGKQPNIRQRSMEFTAEGAYTKSELMNLLQQVRRESVRVLEGLSSGDLGEMATIHYSQEDWDRMKDRGEQERNPFYQRKIESILVHTAEHYGYHTGQIVLLTKLLQTNRESITGFKH